MSTATAPSATADLNGRVDQPPAGREPLWPIPLEIVGVTGEYQAGKSLFLATLNPDPETTLVYDLEKSLGSYAGQLGFNRIDFPLALAKKFPRDRFPNGYKPVDVFTAWRDHILSQPVGRWRVIAVDPINDIQDGLAAWVKDNAAYFGRTPAQYLKMSQLLWADTKAYLKQLLNEIAARCETFAFTTHMRDEYRGQQKTGKREAKGVETFYEMASVYLQLERKPDKEGRMPMEPSAIVIKDRLAKLQIDPQSLRMRAYPVLPQRIPVCTPEDIREYMRHPAGAREAKLDELAPEKTLTDDERLQMRLATAEAERDAEAIRLERQSQAESRATQSRTRTAPTPTPTTNTVPTTAVQQSSPTPRKGTLSDEQRDQLKALFDALKPYGLDQAAWSKILSSRGVKSALELSRGQATELINKLWHRLSCEEIDEETLDPALKEIRAHFARLERDQQREAAAGQQQPADSKSPPFQAYDAREETHHFPKDG